MKKPTLRFRQVFEHPTHFKVTKPLGNPLIIAKKGLSPSLQTRLRKFAQGGEVRGYQIGGEVQDDFSTLPPDITTSPEAKQLQDQDIKTFMDAFAGSGGDEPPVPQPAIPAAVPAPAVAPAPTPIAPVPVEPVPAAEVASPVEAEPVAAAPEPEVTPAEAEKAEAAAAVDEGLAEINLDRNRLAKLTPLERVAAMNYVKASAAAKAQAKMDTAAAEQDVDKMQQEYTQQKAELTRLNTFAKQAHDTERKILEEYDHLKNPQDYFSNLSTGDQIATAIGLMLGAFASGITKTPNAAMAIYNSAIENDLARQKRQSDSRYQRLVAAGHSVENAEQLYRAQMKLVGAAELNRRGAVAKLPQVRARIQTETAKFVSDALRTYAQVAKDERAAVVAEKKAPLEIRELESKVKFAEGAEEREAYKRAMEKADNEFKLARLNFDRAVEARRAKHDAEKLQFEKELEGRKVSEDEAQRTFNVAGMPVQAKDKTQARTVEDGIFGESEFIDLAEQTLKVFRDNPKAAHIPMTGANNTAKLYLGQLLEKYPKSERFRRPLNVTASKVIKEAMGSMQGLTAAVFDRPEDVLTAMINEAKEARRQAIKTFARPDAKGQAQARAAIEALEKGEMTSADVGFEAR